MTKGCPEGSSVDDFLKDPEDNKRSLCMNLPSPRYQLLSLDQPEVSVLTVVLEQVALGPTFTRFHTALSPCKTV